MTPRRRRLVAVAGVLVGLGAVAAFGIHQKKKAAEGARVAELATAASAFRFDWPRGARYTYTVAWSGESRVRVPAMGAGVGTGGDEPIEGSYDLDVDLALRSYGKSGERFFFAATIDPSRRHRFLVMGRDLLGGDAARDAFAGREAYLELAPNGAVARVLFKRDAPPLFKTLAQAILGQLSVSLPDGPTSRWSVAEAFPNGNATSEYEVTSVSPLLLARARHLYDPLTVVPPSMCVDCRQAVDDHGSIALDARGYVSSIADDETLKVTQPRGDSPVVATRASFSARVVDVGTWDAPAGWELDMASLEAHRAGERAEGASPDAMLARRVGDMQVEDMESGIASYAATGKLPPDGAFLTRASGLLLQHPELCDRLVAIFSRDGEAERGRALVLDLLASAGSSKAQSAMRAALETPAARADQAAYRQYLQRFTFLHAPDAESAAFVAGIYDRAARAHDDSLRYASAYSLGALAGALAKKGDADGARRYGDLLRGDLVHATTTRDKRELLVALGSAGEERNVATIRDFAKDASPEVRIGAARALKNVRSTEARDALVGLAADADPDVEATALDSLGPQTLNADETHRFTQAVMDGRTSPHNDASLVSFVGAHPDPVEDARAILAVVRARTSDPSLQGRVDFVLAQLAARAAK